MTGNPRPDLPALTGVRGVAAWFVVLYHIRGAAGGQLPEWLIAILAKGYLAVDLFFMLSGFVLWLNYSNKLRQGGFAAAPQFLARRIARIWPLHLLILAGAVAFAAILQASGRPNPAQFPWTELPLHILLIQNWGLTSALGWNDPAWSISCELAAYLLFPLLALVADWRRLSDGVLAGIVVATAIGLHWLMRDQPNLGSDIPRFGLARALAEFLIGTLVCALWSSWREQPRRPLLASIAVSLLSSAALLTGAMPETLAVPFLFAALLLALALAPANPLGSRPLHYLGEISYATYLLHFLLFILFKLLFVSDASAVPLPLLGLFLALTFAGSVLLHHFVESPAQRALNRAFGRQPKAALSERAAS